MFSGGTEQFPLQQKQQDASDVGEGCYWQNHRWSKCFQFFQEGNACGREKWRSQIVGEFWIWSGRNRSMCGQDDGAGLFYLYPIFGTDQSQVQRYLFRKEVGQKPDGIGLDEWISWNFTCSSSSYLSEVMVLCVLSVFFSDRFVFKFKVPNLTISTDRVSLCRVKFWKKNLEEGLLVLIRKKSKAFYFTEAH